MFYWLNLYHVSKEGKANRLQAILLQGELPVRPSGTAQSMASSQRSALAPSSSAKEKVSSVSVPRAMESKKGKDLKKCHFLFPELTRFEKTYGTKHKHPALFGIGLLAKRESHSISS